MILCIGVLCVAVLVPVVGRKKVSSEVRRAAVVMILVSALAILAQISEEMESGGIELELVRPSYGEGDYEEEMTVDAEGILDGYSYQVVVPERILSKQEEQKLLEAAQQEIDDEFVKNNGEVREKAEIRKNYQEGAVSADWEFEPYDVVDDEGRVVEENIPENGILVKAAVTLRCESSECIISLSLSQRSVTSLNLSSIASSITSIELIVGSFSQSSGNHAWFTISFEIAVLNSGL